MHKILANTIFLGKDIISLPECHSTNDLAMQRYKQGLAHEGSIIITENQTKGRGQRGNDWLSEPFKNLTFTLVLSPSFLDASEQFDLNILITLAIREVLGNYSTGIKVKWPNDIFHERDGKLGGVLIENTVSQKGIDISFIGIGLNINQLSFAFKGPTSLAILAGGEVHKDEVFKLIIKSIEIYYLKLKRGYKKQMRAEYIRHLYRYDEWFLFEDKQHVFKGKIVGISEEGELIIKDEHDSINQYSFQQVKFR
ncbi:biotin--[acetyl-CoA-carboxylase] ligase [Anditalea andensis]|uniref:Biotin--acetyl-CoA-carboxylase ligase n=1 Tax=Anditalea andensis TaxID=1048983 RepID=A0A074KW14_9BACT|nr:biotin--[acetyl-CoA-carboxylase] ligase [Anditalea andensis]KEO72450.1 biotin--acetyl-CoA-carboxylase ligase [Anditalea andensis]